MIDWKRGRREEAVARGGRTSTTSETVYDMTEPRPAAGGVSTQSDPARGAPCWVSLAARDLEGPEKFYGSVLGWQFRPTSLGDRFVVAMTGGRPVAGIGAVAAELQVAVAWTPYFAVGQADEAAARIRERSATVALGPMAFAVSGRALLAADRDGAVFGVWDGRMPGGWQTWRDEGPVVVRLRTRDAFEAAIFYGGVLEWDKDHPDAVTVAYEDDEVVVRSRGSVVARLSSGAVGAAPDPDLRPHWSVQFRVPDVRACAEAARDMGGSVLDRGRSPAGEYAELRDPDGARFTVLGRPPRR
jgi:predicted enzyme related to lactoylglutathione lyase